MQPSFPHRRTRRTLLKGAAATGLAAAAAGVGRRPSVLARGARQSGTPVPDWARFDDAVRAGMETFRVPGVAMAVVDPGGVVHSATFGVRDLASGARVTAETHFQVASTTKSMTALLVATLIDDGLLGWDQPAREVWPDFRAPTPELTETLRVRDLLGMDTGLGEAEADQAFHQGDPTAGELTRRLAILPVTDPPNTKFFYNGSVYAVGGYMPAFAEGAAESDLETVYARQMAERVYRPSGMATARIADDPRPYVADYATGYAPDYATQQIAPQPFAPVGSYAPVGGTQASLNDMANYVAMQLNRGVSTVGARVVSARNLEECWAPQIDLPAAPELAPEVASVGYGMGWITQTYDDGRRMVSHAGGIDGFTSFIAFFPDDHLGLVVLTNAGPTGWGTYFGPLYVTNLLLSERFGLAEGVNDVVVGLYRADAQRYSDLVAGAGPVDPDAIVPYLGAYEKGWRLAFDADGELRLRQSSRALRLLAQPDGSYVTTGGLVPGTTVRLARDENDTPFLEIEGLETVRWTVGPETAPGPAAPPTS